MFVKRLVATAVFAIAATGITMATAHGEGSLADVDIGATAGTVGYTTTLAADHTYAVVNLDSGRFALTSDGVQMIADDGAVVGVIPTTLRVETGQSLAVAPTLNSETQLTLTPVGGPTPAAAATSTQDLPFIHSVDANGGAILAGAVVGCLVGIVIGIWFFLVGAIVGCAIGAAIGGFIGAVA
ncbi:hypothetical protein LTV02_18215 [Nocardia yamanashiensis]|uniref:hypothetical protein n=1 Tax=Nocardia yamanashiensis TaxID=209247 RepID=UPI00082BF184|nr:hypothetical protein [Nocardia yamanashiensis]UGT45202.1 hypothetical protein LTV02_18215 [Nocardia yamanashiensis]